MSTIITALTPVELVYQYIAQAVSFITKKFGNRKHKVLMILGSGLGESIRGLKHRRVIDYKSIPNFPVSTAPGHAGKLVSGLLGNTWVLIMMGRPHMYEGYTAQQIGFPIRVAYLLGVRTVIITNACGGLNREYKTDDIMLIQDQINNMGDNALIGPNLDRFGERFPGMIHAYDERLGQKMVNTAKVLHIPYRVGTYTAVKGPSYETKGEMRALIHQRADAVGMSTIQETITANHCTKRGRMKVVGISVVTDMCKPDDPEVVSEKLVIASANRVAPRLGKLLTTFIKRNKF